MTLFQNTGRDDINFYIISNIEEENRPGQIHTQLTYNSTGDFLEVISARVQPLEEKAGWISITLPGGEPNFQTKNIIIKDAPNLLDYLNIQGFLQATLSGNTITITNLTAFDLTIGLSSNIKEHLSSVPTTIAALSTFTTDVILFDVMFFQIECSAVNTTLGDVSCNTICVVGPDGKFDSKTSGDVDYVLSSNPHNIYFTLRDDKRNIVNREFVLEIKTISKEFFRKNPEKRHLKRPYYVLTKGSGLTRHLESDQPYSKVCLQQIISKVQPLNGEHVWMDSKLPDDYKISGDTDVEFKQYPFKPGPSKLKAFVFDTTQAAPPYTVQLTAPSDFKYGFQKITQNNIWPWCLYNYSGSEIRKIEKSWDIDITSPNYMLTLYTNLVQQLDGFADLFFASNVMTNLDEKSSMTVKSALTQHNDIGIPLLLYFELDTPITGRIQWFFSKLRGSSYDDPFSYPNDFSDTYLKSICANILHFYILRSEGYLDYPSNGPIRSPNPPYSFTTGVKPSNLFSLHYECQEKQQSSTFSLTQSGLYDLGWIKYNVIVEEEEGPNGTVIKHPLYAEACSNYFNYQWLNTPSYSNHYSVNYNFTQGTVFNNVLYVPPEKTVNRQKQGVPGDYTEDLPGLLVPFNGDVNIAQYLVISQRHLELRHVKFTNPPPTTPTWFSCSADNPFYYGPFDPFIDSTLYGNTQITVQSQGIIYVNLHDLDHFKEETANVFSWKQNENYPYDFKYKDYDIVFGYVQDTETARLLGNPYYPFRTYISPTPFNNSLEYAFKNPISSATDRQRLWLGYDEGFQRFWYATNINKYTSALTNIIIETLYFEYGLLHGTYKIEERDPILNTYKDNVFGIKNEPGNRQFGNLTYNPTQQGPLYNQLHGKTTLTGKADDTNPWRDDFDIRKSGSVSFLKKETIDPISSIGFVVDFNTPHETVSLKYADQNELRYQTNVSRLLWHPFSPSKNLQFKLTLTKLITQNGKTERVVINDNDKMLIRLCFDTKTD